MYSSKVEQWISSTSRTNARPATSWSDLVVLFLLSHLAIFSGNFLYAKLRGFFISIFRRNAETEAAPGNENQCTDRRLRPMPDMAPSFFVDKVNDSFHLAKGCSFISRAFLPIAVEPCTTCLRTNSTYYWTEHQLSLTPKGRRYHHGKCTHVATKNRSGSRWNLQMKDTVRFLSRCSCVTEL